MKATVNSIFREYGDEFIRGNYCSKQTRKIIKSLIDCRTEALGGHIDECDNCGNTVTLYNSCRNRHCPQCQFMKKEQWIEAKKNEVLPYQYFHTVFTLPDSLNCIVIRNKKIVYKLLFDKVKETLLSVSEDEKYFGAKIGFFSIIHTWGQKLNLHPHIHCVVPGGGYSKGKDKWISCPNNYMVPVKVLTVRFRSLFLIGLKELYNTGKLFLGKSIYRDKKEFQKLIDNLFSKEWIVYIKETFKNSDSVIEYLANYTHRIAISNHRIKSVENRIVSFEYKDYKDGNKKKIIKMDVIDFMKHFLLHIVPYRFVRIRYYGILSHRNKKKSIEDCREYYEIKFKKSELKKWDAVYKDKTGVDIHICQKCMKGKMIKIEDIHPKLSCSGP